MKNERYHCAECDKVMMPTPSGAVCPDGHGRIRGGVDHAALSRYAKQYARWRWVQNLPLAVPAKPDAKRPKDFVVNGITMTRATVLVEGVKRRTPRPGYPHEDGTTAARIGDRPIYVKAKPEKKQR